MGGSVLPRPIAIGIAVLVSLMWAVNLVVGLLYPGRSDPYVNAIFGMVVSAAFVLARSGGSTERSLRQRLADAIAPPPEEEEPAESSTEGDDA